jgi:hypothetical protein
MKSLMKTLLIAIVLIVGGQMGFGYLMKWQYEARKASFEKVETWNSSSPKVEKQMGKLMEKFLEASEGMDEAGSGKKCAQKRDSRGIPIWSEVKDGCR